MPISPQTATLGGAPTTPRAWRQAMVSALLVLSVTWFGGLPARADDDVTVRISEPGPGDLLKSDRQRRQIHTLAKRQLGTTLGATKAHDLRTLQRLLDDRHVGTADVYGQQALGVLLGDAMVRDLPVTWVVVDDRYGHSRALRYRESAELFFPVTMISKRMKVGERVDFKSLYDSVLRKTTELDDAARAKAKARGGRRF